MVLLGNEHEFTRIGEFVALVFGKLELRGSSKYTAVPKHVNEVNDSLLILWMFKKYFFIQLFSYDLFTF